ncbi:MAG: ABC transporter ATPase [Flavobacteriaceae bacterium]|nr:ABC transporter ATPase [Flavobacteriaceae bacterium]
MYVDFEDLPSESKIWIFQSNRPFSEVERTGINNQMRLFVNTWHCYGEGLQASFTVKHNQFIILGVDENISSISGCSVDSSVRIIKLLEDEFGFELFNKLNIAFKIGENMNTVSLAEFQNFVKEDKINGETIVFNNLIDKKGDLDSNWEIPANKSWHNRFLKAVK